MNTSTDNGMTDVSALSGARELFKHETPTSLLSIVDTGDSQLMITDDYGDSWFIDREDVRKMRDALTGWLDGTEHMIDVHEGQS